jgi:hypothetical protein
MEPISRRARSRSKLSLPMFKEHDPYDVSLDLIADIYYYWNKRRDNLRPADFRNKVLITGMLTGLRSTYDLIQSLQVSLPSRRKK